MADSSSEHLIRIIVQGVNRLGDVVDRGTKAVEKHTSAVKKQSKAVEESARTADDARRDFERLAKEIGDGKKDYDSATFALKRLSDEFDRLAKKEDVGSKTSDDLHRSALAAKALSEQLRVAHEIERKINEQDAKDRVRREEERQRLTAETLKKEVEAERKASEHRRSLVGDLLDEVRRDHNERAKLDKTFGDAEVSERVRVEGERQRVVAEAARAEQAAQEQAARNRRGFLDDILDEVRRDHDEQLRLARELDAQDARDHQARLKRRVDEAVEHAQAVTQRSSTTLGRRIAIDPSPRRSLFQRVRAVISGDDSSDPRGFASEVDRVGRSSRTADSGLSRLERTIDRLSGSSDKAGFSIAKVDNNLRGLVVVGVIAFSQQLVSAMIALAGAALAVASAAAQAGLAVGGAFAAAAGQALPTIGLLVAAFGRIGAVFDAVKLFNTQVTKSGFDQAQAADAQAAAADRVVSSNEQVVSASQRVKDATDALTEAREKARRKIEDLNLAERNASLSQFDAERAISKAVASGDVGALEGLRNRRDEAVVGAGRATSAASDARAAGEDRAPEVLAAVRAVDEANTALRRARREADAAGRAATRALRTGSAADRALEQALAQLTPAELVLYESAKRIQKRFRTLFRPITDIIVTAFAGGVDGASKALGDTRVLGTALRLARSIATAISRIGDELTGNRSLDFFKTMGDEAAKNIPLLTTLFIRVSRIMSALSVAGGPALRKFIEFFVDLAGKGEEATNSKSGLAKLERFFLRGETMAESFLKLGGAIIQLFAALSGAGGAQTGLDLVDELTVSIQNATRWVKAHQDQVAAFFDDVARSTRAIGGAIVAISSAALDLFSSDKVIAFADAFERVLLPALVSTATALGEITFLLTKFLSLPGISTIASLALSVGLLFKAFSIFGRLLIPFGAGLARVLGPMRVLGPLAIRLGMAMRVAAVLFTGPWGIAIAAVITGIVLLDKKFHFIRPSIKFIGELFSTAGRIVVDFAGHLGFMIPILNAVGKAITLAFKLTPFGFIAGLAGRFLGFVHSLDASKRALDSVSKAEDKLAESQRKSAAAQRDLTDARRSARRELNDLESSVRSGKLEVRQARFGVRDAKTDLASLRSRGAPKTEIDDAELRLDQARENLRQTTRSAARSEEDYRAAKIKSASADGEIAKASAKARDARRKESESVRDLDRASRDALRSKDSFVGAVSKLGFEGGLAGGLGVELRSLNAEFDRTPSKIERIRSQVDKLKTRLSHLKDGSEEYRDVAEKLRSKQRALNDALGDADEKGKKGARGPRAIGRSAASAAEVVDEAFAAMVKGANKIGGQLGGIKALEYKATFDKGLAGSIAGAVEERATGGWINRKGGPQGPDNRLIRAGDGEAVLAVPHQPIVDRALGFASRFMGGPSNLDEMFGRVKGYVGAFAKGGRVGANFGGHPANVNPFVRSLIALMQGRFPLSVTSTTDHSLRTTSGNLSDHPGGNAVDLSGSIPVMLRAAEYIKSSGLYRKLKQGIHNPNLAVNRGELQRPPGQFAGAVWAQHADHIHLAITGAIGKLAAGISGSIGSPRITGPSGRLREIARKMVSRIARAANRRIDTSSSVDGSGDLSGGGGGQAGGSRQIRSWIYQGLKLAGLTPSSANINTLFGRVMQESGGNPRAINLNDSNARAGDPSKGLLQTISATFNAYKVKGHGNIYNAVDNVAAAARYMIARYGHLVGAGPGGYEHGGSVPGRGPKSATLHGGEHVWTAMEVLKAGGHKVMYALRRMLGGGTQGGPDGFADGGVVGLERLVSGDVSRRYAVPDVFDTSLSGVLSELGRARAAIATISTKATEFAINFARSIGQITDDGGLLDQATSALSRMSASAATRLKKLVFVADGSGRVVRRLSADQEAAAQIANLDKNTAGLRSVQGATQASLDDVDRRLAGLRKGGVTAKEQKAYTVLVAARRSLVKRIDDLDGQIADAVESRFQAQEQIIQSAVDGVNTSASRQLARGDLSDRLAALIENVAGGSQTAFGMRGRTLQNRGNILSQQRDALLPLLLQARSQGSTGIADDLLAAIEDLNVSIAENVAAIDHNTVAARQSAIDSITGRGNFLGGTLGGLGNIVKNLGALSGREDVGRLRDIAQAAALVLGQTGTGLRQQLLEGFGLDLRGLDPSGLVDTLRSLNFDGIEAVFNVEQRQQFEGLVAAIIDNASAVVDNTQQLAEMNSSRLQSFSTTAWELFRQAIFNGSGGLLPQYRSLMPTSASTMSGAALTAGFLPRANGSSSITGDSNINVNVTNPTVTTDPNWIGEVLAVKRPLARAT